jgi:hypothetical protein
MAAKSSPLGADGQTWILSIQLAGALTHIVRIAKQRLAQ